MSHHIGAWMHRPASILIAPHRIRRDKEKPEENEDAILTALRIDDRQSLSGIQPVKTNIHY